MTPNQTSDMTCISVTIIVPDTEFSVPFVQGMASRMAISYSKYGHVNEESVKKFDPLLNLEARLARYRETGNTEWLMDVGNCAMIEFMFPQHPGAHFHDTDSDESPGRSLRSTGAMTQQANTHDVENRRLGCAHGATAGGFYRHEGD